MDKKVLIELKQELSALETDEKALQETAGGKKRNKNIGKVMSICLLIGFGVANINDSLSGMLLLTGIIGLFVWIIGSRAEYKAYKKLELVTNEIKEVKDKIIVEEHS